VSAIELLKMGREVTTLDVLLELAERLDKLEAKIEEAEYFKKRDALLAPEFRRSGW
jgi:hypothetical protein